MSLKALSAPKSEKNRFVGRSGPNDPGGVFGGRLPIKLERYNKDFQERGLPLSDSKGLNDQNGEKT